MLKNLNYFILILVVTKFYIPINADGNRLSKRDVTDENADESTKEPLIKISPNSYAKVVDNKVIVYSLKNRKWIKAKPISVKKFVYNIPLNVETVYNSKSFDYFLRKGKYCKRKIRDRKVCKKWIPISGLFGCKSRTQSNAKLLCGYKNIDSIFELMNKIYVIKDNKYWEFKKQKNSNKPFGDLIKGNKDLDKRFHGLNAWERSIAVHSNKLIVIGSHKWKQLKSNGQVDGSGNLYENVNGKLVKSEETTSSTIRKSKHNESQDITIENEGTTPINIIVANQDKSQDTTVEYEEMSYVYTPINVIRANQNESQAIWKLENEETTTINIRLTKHDKSKDITIENDIKTNSSRGLVYKINDTAYATVVKNKLIVYVIKNKKWIKSKPQSGKYNLVLNNTASNDTVAKQIHINGSVTHDYGTQLSTDLSQTNTDEKSITNESQQIPDESQSTTDERELTTVGIDGSENPSDIDQSFIKLKNTEDIGFRAAKGSKSANNVNPNEVKQRSLESLKRKKRKSTKKRRKMQNRNKND